MRNTWAKRRAPFVQIKEHKLCPRPGYSSRSFIEVNYHWPTICWCVYAVSMVAHKSSRAHLSGTETIGEHHTHINLSEEPAHQWMLLPRLNSRFLALHHIRLHTEGLPHIGCTGKNVYMGLHHLGLCVCVCVHMKGCPLRLAFAFITSDATLETFFHKGDSKKTVVAGESVPLTWM